MNNKLILNNNVILNNLDDYNQALDLIFNTWLEKKSAIVNYIYWASYPLIGKDEKYTSSLLSSDILLPDGIGMYIYIKAILNSKLNNLNGTDFNPVLIEYIFKNNIMLNFYGATVESISKAVNNLSSQKKMVSYFQDGYSDLEWSRINSNSVLMVGLGTPKQEYWVYDNLDIIREKNLLVITVGGYFDFLSGMAKRAPLIFRSLRLEWLYRIPQCKRERNLRNLFLLNHILKDRSHIRKLNKHKINQ